MNEPVRDDAVYNTEICTTNTPIYTLTHTLQSGERNKKEAAAENRAQKKRECAVRNEKRKLRCSCVCVCIYVYTLAATRNRIYTLESVSRAYIVIHIYTHTHV